MHSGAVLVVDDDQAVAGALSQSLAGLGWEVDVAFDLNSAVSRLEEREFDALVVDLRLPEADGLTMLERIGQMPEHSRPVAILLSGYLDVQTAVKALRAGAADVVEKPVQPADLDQRLRQCLSERQQRRSEPPDESVESLRPSETLRVFERRVIEHTWESSERNLSAAARKLGLPRTTLRDRLRKYGLR